MEVIQIVPALPPAVNGLGDYASLLAKELWEAHNIRSRFVVGDPNWGAIRGSMDFPAEHVRERTADCLIECLGCRSSNTVVILHYVGYGYAKRGCPFWLRQGIRQWREWNPSARLITIFHELFASGAIWRSSFWNSPFQKALVKSLADVSDCCLTTPKIYAVALEELSPKHRGRIVNLPVFSTIGELQEGTIRKGRERQMVVFGAPALRLATYAHHCAELVRACELLHIRTIVDIGMPIGSMPEIPFKLVKVGSQSAENVRNLLAESCAGFLSYFDGYLAKSSVFAAYCANGLLPILPCENHSHLDGLRAGEHYLLFSELSISPTQAQMQRIAESATQWYDGHSISETAAKLASCVKKVISL